MSYLERMKLDKLAYELTALEFRPPIVDMLTTKGIRQTRDLWRELHGYAPPKGLLPASATTCLRTPLNVSHANSFLNIYIALLPEQAVREDTCIPLKTELLITAFRHYKTITRGDEDVLTADKAYVVLRDIQCGISRIRYCTTCRCYWIYNQTGTRMQRCSNCKSMDTHRRRQRKTA